MQDALVQLLVRGCVAVVLRALWEAALGLGVKLVLLVMTLPAELLVAHGLLAEALL